ncbi:ATP-binding protein [Dorea formicigenerans]|uniref:HD domain-containing protein n=1 Tax=Dorea formicigenerans TaxID=39486 RepID=UPI0011C1CBBA|nr:ATP-binding protein [Dorea formicigenerans]
MATILRLADIIDFDPKRTPSVLFSHLAVKNPVSLNEWKKHQSINAWTISPKRILFSAQCEHPAIEATILAFCNQIDEELRNGTVILSNLSDDGMGINMETYKIPLPPQVDRRKIQAKKDIISGKPIYRYHDTKFSLSKKQIIDLLMGTKLYGKPEVALRELLQNSIDACLLRQKLSELWGIEYTPKVKVSLYTKNNVDYLQVSDNGVGMNQHIIDNYYTNIGCSYYSSREFSDLMVSFKSSFTPISRFGIGILSCFMVCDSMEVTTRRIRERFECDEALHVSIEGYESLFVISDSDKKDPGTDTILTLRPVHPWDRMDEDEFVQCIKGIVPNPAVQIEIETDKRSESYSSDYFDDLDLSPLLDYSWNNTKNIRKIDIDLTCEEYGFKGRGCIGILIKNDMPVEEIEILSKDVEIDGEIYTLSSSVKYKNNCITETSTSISVDEDGEIDTNTSWSERFKSKSSLSIHGIEVPYNLFPNYSNKMSKAVLNILFPFSFRLDIGVNSDLNLNSARDQIIYDEKWLTFEENLYQVICKRLKEQLSLSDWERLNEIIQKNGKNIFSRVANNIE